MRKPTVRADVNYHLFEVRWGWCAAARSENGICAFILPVDSEVVAEAEIIARYPESKRSRSGLNAIAEAAQRYFDGWTTHFTQFPLDLTSGTPFQQKVWSILPRIPYGQVRTYHWVGMEMGRPEASRAIGAAVGANPLPLLLPCHRVVASNGLLTGFSACGGIDLKARMLEMEHVKIHGQGTHRRAIA